MQEAGSRSKSSIMVSGPNHLGYCCLLSVHLPLFPVCSRQFSDMSGNCFIRIHARFVGFTCTVSVELLTSHTVIAEVFVCKILLSHFVTTSWFCILTVDEALVDDIIRKRVYNLNYNLEKWCHMCTIYRQKTSYMWFIFVGTVLYLLWERTFKYKLVKSLLTKTKTKQKQKQKSITHLLRMCQNVHFTTDSLLWTYSLSLVNRIISDLLRDQITKVFLKKCFWGWRGGASG